MRLTHDDLPSVSKDESMSEKTVNAISKLPWQSKEMKGLTRSRHNVKNCGVAQRDLMAGTGGISGSWCKDLKCNDALWI